MCDTLVYVGNDSTWLAKNSDREPDEYQCLEAHPRIATRPEELQTTYTKVPVNSPCHAVIIGRPYWMWGAEMGVNEYGVAIGNEAVFTRLVEKKNSGLLGMDLLRLALETAKTADTALSTITRYLETYGQGGAAGHHRKNTRYDNSFIIADPGKAFILETAGRFWVAKNVQGYAAISNDLTIGADFDFSSFKLEDNARQQGYWNGKGDFDFRRTFRSKFMPWAAKSAYRQNCNLVGLAEMSQDTLNEAGFINLLRQHHDETPRSNADVCMHAGRLTRRSATVAAMVAELKQDGASRVLMCQGQPCQNEFMTMEFATNGVAK